MNCKSHGWCTSHDETKYLNYCEKIKISLESSCPEVSTISNSKLRSLNHFFNSHLSKNLHQKGSFPRLGTFEIYFRGQIIFSKLNEGR